MGGPGPLNTVVCSLLITLGAALPLGTVARGSVFGPVYQEILASFAGKESLSPCNIDERFGGQGASLRGVLGKKVEIEFCCEAFTTPRLRYVRMVSFAGQGYDVFNFLAVPAPGCNMPLFGADIVALPGGALAAIDFQPLSSSPDYFTSHAAYSTNADKFRAWQNSFPPGGELPAAAKKYFSPYALWTRLGPDSPVEASTARLQLALLDYCHAYTQLLDSTSSQGTTIASNSKSEDDSESFLSEYLTYRIENDPAKRLLVGAFGLEWTEAVLNDVLFKRC